MMRYVLFRASSIDLALPVSEVLEILPCPILQRTPGTASVIGGTFRLGGELAVALRLDRLLGLEDRPPGLYSPLLRLRHAPQPCFLIVDEVCDVAALHAPRPCAAHRVFSNAVIGQIDGQGRSWHLLDVQRILQLEEHRALAEHSARADEKVAGDAIL